MNASSTPTDPGRDQTGRDNFNTFNGGDPYDLSHETEQHASAPGPNQNPPPISPPPLPEPSVSPQQHPSPAPPVAHPVVPSSIHLSTAPPDVSVLLNRPTTPVDSPPIHSAIANPRELPPTPERPTRHTRAKSNSQALPPLRSAPLVPPQPPSETKPTQVHPSSPSQPPPQQPHPRSKSPQSQPQLRSQPQSQQPHPTAQPKSQTKPSAFVVKLRGSLVVPQTKAPQRSSASGKGPVEVINVEAEAPPSPILSTSRRDSSARVLPVKIRSQPIPMPRTTSVDIDSSSGRRSVPQRTSSTSGVGVRMVSNSTGRRQHSATAPRERHPEVNSKLMQDVRIPRNPSATTAILQPEQRLVVRRAAAPVGQLDRARGGEFSYSVLGTATEENTGCVEVVPTTLTKHTPTKQPLRRTSVRIGNKRPRSPTREKDRVVVNIPDTGSGEDDKDAANSEDVSIVRTEEEQEPLEEELYTTHMKAEDQDERVSEILAEQTHILTYANLGLANPDLERVLKRTTDKRKAAKSRVCFLDHNQVTLLSRSVCKSLFELKVSFLDLSYNRISSVHSDIYLCSSLHVLTLTHNQLAELPESLGNLRSLEVINVSENKLKSLPKGMNKLRELHVLIVSRNELKTLPDDLASKGSNIHSLDVSGNKEFESLPVCVSNLENLEAFDMNLTIMRRYMLEKDACMRAAHLVRTYAGKTLADIRHRRKTKQWPDADVDTVDMDE